MRATLLTAWTDAQELGDVTPLQFAATAAVLERTMFMNPEYNDPEFPIAVHTQVNLEDGTVQYYCEFADE